MKNKKSHALAATNDNLFKTIFTPSRIVFITLVLIHSGLIYLAYLISAQHIADTQMLFNNDRSSTVWMPAQGNIFLFWGLTIGCIIGMFTTVVIWSLAASKTKNLIQPTFKYFLLSNIVPIVALIYAAYVTFDQLVAILLYTLFLILFIFFKDK